MPDYKVPTRQQARVLAGQLTKQTQSNWIVREHDSYFEVVETHLVPNFKVGDKRENTEMERTYGERPNKVYVASSWRCFMQPAVVGALKAAKIDCYDFRHPKPGNEGFSWQQVMPTWRRELGRVSQAEYLAAIEHPIAIEGFRLDFQAMQECDACVLVQPCGNSAHLELGWFAGQGKRTAVLLENDSVIPDLMYKLADYICPSLWDLLGWLGVED